MKVSLRRGPNVLGVRTGVDLDTNDLPPVEAQELQRLVEQAQGAAGGQALAPAPDQRNVTISVEAANMQLKVAFPEGTPPPAVEPLLEYLDRHSKVIPSE